MRDIAAPDRQVPVRRLDLESTFDDVPRHFAGGADGAGGDLIQSHVWMCLSGIFPDGEDFFVRSVRHYRDHIDDPTLKRQVAGFIGQEVMHGREHRGLNERLDRHGYPVKHIEKWNRRWLEFQSRSLPRSSTSPSPSRSST